MNLEEIKKIYDNCITMSESGLLRTMTDAERIRFKEAFPHVEIIMGDFVILKVEHYRKLVDGKE